LRVAGSSGLAPCALSHWISLRPVIAGSRPVSLGSRGSFKGRLVLQIVTDIVFIHSPPRYTPCRSARCGSLWRAWGIKRGRPMVSCSSLHFFSSLKSRNSESRPVLRSTTAEGGKQKSDRVRILSVAAAGSLQPRRPMASQSTSHPTWPAKLVQ
jgi:hypothetical protein